jgi:homospermidine synthase
LETTNYWLRANALSRRGGGRSTCVIAHGANPGLVSHFLRPALRAFAEQVGLRHSENFIPAELSEKLGIKVVQIAERDTQYAELRESDRAFYNTWSVDGLLSEAGQYAEVAWGTHEKELPCGASRHDDSAKSGVVLQTASVDTTVASWVPSAGAQQAFLITHHEAHSIGDFLASYSSNGSVKYRPSVYYAYRPSDLTCRSLEKWQASGREIPLKKITMCGELAGGMDELGVLLVSDQGSLWYGSTLTLSQARSLAKHNNATSLQVAASVMGALDWMLANPCAGVVEAEDMDSDHILSVAAPYLGKLGGAYSDWTPRGSSGLTMDEFLEGL